MRSLARLIVAGRARWIPAALAVLVTIPGALAAHHDHALLALILGIIAGALVAAVRFFAEMEDHATKIRARLVEVERAFDDAVVKEREANVESLRAIVQATRALLWRRAIGEEREDESERWN